VASPVLHARFSGKHLIMLSPEACHVLFPTHSNRSARSAPIEQLAGSPLMALAPDVAREFKAYGARLQGPPRPRSLPPQKKLRWPAPPLRLLHATPRGEAGGAAGPGPCCCERWGCTAFRPKAQGRARGRVLRAGVNARGELLTLTVPTEKSRGVCKVVGRQQLQLPAGPARLAALRGHLLLAYPGGVALLNVTARGAPQHLMSISNAELAGLFAGPELGEAGERVLQAVVGNDEAFVGVALLPGTLAVLQSSLPAYRPQDMWWIKLLRPVLLVGAVAVGGMQFIKGRQRLVEGQRRRGGRRGRPGLGEDFDDDEDFGMGGALGADPLALGRMSRAAREMRRRYPHVDFDRVAGGAEGSGGGGPHGSRSSGDGDDEGDAQRFAADGRRSKVRFSETVEEFPPAEYTGGEEEGEEEEGEEGGEAALPAGEGGGRVGGAAARAE
jgi:hypothetical protein